MKRNSNRGLATAAASVALLTLSGACSDQIEQPATDFNNEYVKAFIDRYGIPDPDHDWSMATTAGLKVKSEKPVSLRVLAEVNGQRYLFADLAAYQGNEPIPAIIPKNVDRLILEVNGMEEYVCGANDIVDLDALASAPRSRDYFDMNMTEPSDGNDYGRITLDLVASSEKGRVIKYDIADNEAILEIIERPYESEYILYEEYDTEDGVHVKDPLMPSLSSMIISQRAEANHKLADYEFMPLYVRSDKPDNTEAEYKFRLLSKDNYIDDVRYLSTSYTPTFDNTTYNIGYIDETGKTKNITNPTESCQTWCGKTFKVCANEKDFAYGLYYCIYNSEDNTTGSYKSTYPENLTWDTEIGGPTDAYSSCLYFDNVPFTYYDEKGEKKTDLVYVYAIFASPTETAQTRPDKADFFIVEFYDHDLLGHTAFFPTTNPGFSYRMMAEDLGMTDDWDFNDLVVDFTAVLTNKTPIFGDGRYVHPNTEDYYADKWLKTNVGQHYVYHVTVTPRAAGGTMPIYLGCNGKMFTTLTDISSLKGKKVSEVMKMSKEELSAYASKGRQGNYQIGPELHSWLGGNSTEETINTEVITNTGRSIEFDIESFSNVRLFSIVDKENTLQAQPIDGEDYLLINENDAYYQYNYNATQNTFWDETARLVPQRIFLTTDFPWAKERKDFGSAYPEFAEWIKHSGYGLGWFSSRNKNLTVEVE